MTGTPTPSGSGAVASGISSTGAARRRSTNPTRAVASNDMRIEIAIEAMIEADHAAALVRGEPVPRLTTPPGDVTLLEEGQQHIGHLHVIHG